MVLGKFCLDLCLVAVAVETLQLGMWTCAAAEVGH